VDLGVDGRRGRARVPQNLADLGQRRTPTQHVCGGGVTKTMRPDSPKPGTVTTPIHDLGHRRRHQRRVWCADPTKHDTMTNPGSPRAHIFRQRSSHLNGQREHIDTSGLATNVQLSATPVDIVQLDPGDLSRPQTKTD